MYRCAACSKPVLVIKGLIVRRCSCTAPIVAEMTAKLEGKGGIR